MTLADTHHFLYLFIPWPSSNSVSGKSYGVINSKQTFAHWSCDHFRYFVVRWVWRSYAYLIYHSFIHLTQRDWSWTSYPSKSWNALRWLFDDQANFAILNNTHTIIFCSGQTVSSLPINVTFLPLFLRQTIYYFILLFVTEHQAYLLTYFFFTKCLLHKRIHLLEQTLIVMSIRVLTYHRTWWMPRIETKQVKRKKIQFPKEFSFFLPHNTLPLLRVEEVCS